MIPWKVCNIILRFQFVILFLLTVPIEEADSEIKDLLASDFDIAEMIRLHILPRAIIYYTGEGIDDDYSEMDEMDEFDEDEFGEEDEEEDEEEGIEVVTSSGDKRKSKGLVNGSDCPLAKKTNPNECKQQ